MKKQRTFINRTYTDHSFKLLSYNYKSLNTNVKPFNQCEVVTKEFEKIETKKKQNFSLHQILITPGIWEL